MKRLLYIFLAAAATLVAAGCNREVDVDDALMGEMVKATFGVGFAESPTKAVGDGLTATQLVVGVYDKELGYVETLSVPPTSEDYKDAFVNLSATYETRLVKGHSYSLVFLAVAPGNGVYDIDLAKHTLTVKTSGVSNDEIRDAFYAVSEVEEVSDVVSQTVTLERPMAQFNVVTTKKDYEDALAAQVKFQKSGLKVKAPSVLNLLDGSVDTEVEYDLSAAPMADLKVGYEPYKTNGDVWLLTDYILVGESEIHDVTFSLYSEDRTDPQFAYFVPSVPFKRNWRTTVYGEILTTDGQFTLTINPMCSGDEAPISIEENRPQIVMADPSLKPAGSTITVAPGETLNFKASHPVEGIVPTYSSSDEKVGTITDDGAFTAVGEGTTVVTVSFPAVSDGKPVTKGDTDYVALDLTWNVVVADETPQEVEATITASDVTVQEGKTISIGATTNSTAAIQYAVADATVATVSDAGVVTGVKAGKTTVTLSVEAVEGAFTAATKTINVTVTAAQTPPPSGEGITIDGNLDDWAGITDSFVTESNRIVEWKYSSDDSNVYFLYKITKEKIKFDEEAASYDWKSYIYIGFDMDSDETTGKAGENGGTGDGMEAIALVFPWRGETEGDPQIFSGLETQGKIEYPAGTATESYVTTAGKFDGDYCYIEVSLPLEVLGSPSGTITVNHAMDYYSTGRAEITLGGDAPAGPKTATITASNVSVEVGKTAEIGATTNSTAAIQYAVADATIATVSDKGVVTGVKAGSTTVTLSVDAVEGAFTAASKEITVTVKDASAPATGGITIDGSFDDWADIEGFECPYDGDRFVLWKAASDKDNVYFYYKITKSKVKFDEENPDDGYNWKSYIYVGFDLDNDPTTGSQGEHGGAGVSSRCADGGLEAVGLVFPWTGTTNGSPEARAGEDANSSIQYPIGTETEYKITTNGAFDSDFAYVEISLPRAAIGSPASGAKVTVNNAMNYYPSGRQQIVLK